MNAEHEGIIAPFYGWLYLLLVAQLHVVREGWRFYEIEV